jgi:uncharacterized membrane protein YqiK
MNEGRNITKSFNDKSLSQFLQPYTTKKARQQAIDTFEQSERATAAAFAAFKKVADKNKPAPEMHLTPENARKEYELRRKDVYKANEKLNSRIDKIKQAKDNRLERIKKSQELEKRVEQKMGRSLSNEFNRRR